MFPDVISWDWVMYTVLPGTDRGRGSWLLLGRLEYDDKGQEPGFGQRMKV
jgi:hypothetical protein